LLVYDLNNCTTVPLVADDEFIGEPTYVGAYNQVHVSLKQRPHALLDGDANTAQGSLYVEFSPDKINWDTSIPLVVRNKPFIPQPYVNFVYWFRVRYLNDGGAAAIASLGLTETADTARNQTEFRLVTAITFLRHS
jgi:hypothetical protein